MIATIVTTVIKHHLFSIIFITSYKLSPFIITIDFHALMIIMKQSIFHH